MLNYNSVTPQLSMLSWANESPAFASSESRSSPVLRFDDLCSKGVHLAVVRAAKRCAKGHGGTTPVQEPQRCRDRW